MFGLFARGVNLANFECWRDSNCRATVINTVCARDGFVNKAIPVQAWTGS